MQYNHFSNLVHSLSQMTAQKGQGQVLLEEWIEYGLAEKWVSTFQILTIVKGRKVWKNHTVASCLNIAHCKRWLLGQRMVNELDCIFGWGASYIPYRQTTLFWRWVLGGWGSSMETELLSVCQDFWAQVQNYSSVLCTLMLYKEFKHTMDALNGTDTELDRRSQ
jgi:hypothetical protein